MPETTRRLRPSPSIIISIFALVVAMSAGAYAATIAPKNSVVSKSIKNKNVKSADIKPGAVKKTHLASNSVDSSKIVDGQVGSSEIADGSVGTNDLSDAAKTDVNDASTLGGLTVAQIVAASGGEYLEAKQLAGAVSMGTSVTELASLNLPHAGKYLVNVRVPIVCKWDGTNSPNPDAAQASDLDVPNFPVFASLSVGGTAVESQDESCQIEQHIDGGLFGTDVWTGTKTVEFTRMVTATGPTTVSVSASQNTSFGFGTIENKYNATATASESHVQAITVQ